MSQEQAQQVSSAEQEDKATSVSSYGAAEHHDAEEEHIHLPGPSYWPILLAAGMAFTLIGLMIDISFAFAGLILSFIFGIGWAMNWGLESHQEAQAHVE